MYCFVAGIKKELSWGDAVEARVTSKLRPMRTEGKGREEEQITNQNEQS